MNRKGSSFSEEYELYLLTSTNRVLRFNIFNIYVDNV